MAMPWSVMIRHASLSGALTNYQTCLLPSCEGRTFHQLTPRYVRTMSFKIAQNGPEMLCFAERQWSSPKPTCGCISGYMAQNPIPRQHGPPANHNFCYFH